MGWVLLVLGLVLWTGAHLFKRVMPEARARMGDTAKIVVAVLVLVSVALMYFGYRDAYGPVWWGRHPATVGINNLFNLFAVYLFAASGMKTRITAYIRHPQLTAVKTWAIGHLIVNGDLASFVLFGGLLAWAVAEVVLINRQTARPAPPPPASMGKEIGAVVGTLVVYGLIAWVHYWFGYPAFG
ncbi:NnrU family protein [Rhodosalinus sp.]|uniref:NnrU family protein n=1 Tax=Rhodosalinus sp. TaxID=2047741 RepID=UPI0035681258